jgi:hypothetical protein
MVAAMARIPEASETSGLIRIKEDLSGRPDGFDEI